MKIPLLVGGAVLLAGAALAQMPPRPDSLPHPADETRVHDPVIARENGTYYVFATGRGISLTTSPDKKMWTRVGRVLPDTPAWTTELVPGSNDYWWAPDISFWNKRWHLYYSVSTFGKNRSVVGLATNATLDPKSPNYKWVDEGPIVKSVEGDNYNAIDPAFAFDENKKPYLFFGSFWSGVRAVELDPATGKQLHPDQAPLYIATRPRETNGAIEAPFVVHHGDYFYLFASFDICCRGVQSTYNIRVGRSAKLTGPYLDRDGKSMLEGGGTLVRTNSTRWKGPGHNAVWHDDDTKQDYLIYHAYDARANGASKLRIEPLSWTPDGWPSVPATPADDPAPAPAQLPPA